MTDWYEILIFVLVVIAAYLIGRRVFYDKWTAGYWKGYWKGRDNSIHDYEKLKEDNNGPHRHSR